MTDRELLAENEKMIGLMRDRMLHVGEVPRPFQRPVRTILKLLLRYFLMVRREGIYRG